MSTMIDEEIKLDDARPVRRRGDGVLELVELGREKPPMISNRLSGGLESVLSFFKNVVFDGIAKLSGVLSDIIKIPTDLINAGVDLVLLNFASIVTGIPIIGDFAAAILVATDAIIKFAVSLPELVLKQIATLAAGMKTLTPAQQQAAFGSALKLIQGSAPADIKPDVAKAIENAPASYGVSFGPSVWEVLGGLAAVAVPIGIGIATKIIRL